MPKKLNFNCKHSKKISAVFVSNWDDIFNMPSNNRIQPLIKTGLINSKRENNYFLINILAKEYLSRKTYLEIGTHRGASLISAAWRNPTTRCIGIDHFELHCKPGEDIEQQLKININYYETENVEYYKMEGNKGIEYLFKKEPDLKIDMFYYDATHEYKPQLETMQKMVPYLADNCIICVDDLNIPGVLNALYDFLAEFPIFNLNFIIVPSVSESNWWKGWAIITRGDYYV